MSAIPDVFRVLFTTTQGPFTVEAHKEWSPLGSERFYRLVKDRFFDDTRIFRVKPEWVVQFGVSGDPRISKIWKGQFLQDEPVVQSNLKGTVAFAMDETPNSRTTQIFINYSDNLSLDARGFVPFAKVVEGMETTEKFYSGYGEAFRDQEAIEEKGNAFLDSDFPKLDRILSAEIFAS